MIELGTSPNKLRNYLHALTALGALWFERAPGRTGEYGYRYHIDLAPMIALDA